MAQEDKSVRKLVQEIEARTGKLDKAIDKLSDSLVRIGDSLAKPPEEGPGREDLIKKFKQPFASPEAVKSESNSEELLDQIKDAIVFNQKDNFALFKSIDDTLKKIESMGGGFGGGVGVDVGRRGSKGGAPDTKKAAETPDKKVKPGSPQAAAAGKLTDKAGQKAAGGTLSKVGGTLAKGAKFIPGVGLAVAGGMAVADTYSAATEAEKVLDIKDREATLGEKVSAGAGGLVEGLTFGLMSRERAAKGIESARQGVVSFFGGGEKKESATQQPVGSAPTIVNQNQTTNLYDREKAAAMPLYDREKAASTPSITTVKPAPSTAGAIATANIRGAGPDWKYIEEQRKKRAGVTPVTPVAGEQTSIKKDESTVSGSKQPTLNDLAMEEAKKFGRDKPNVDDRKAASLKFRKQQLEGKLEGTVTGSVVAPTPSTQPSQTVNQMSQENMDMREGGQAVQPVVINNSSSVATNTQTFTPLRASARPNNNSFERKQNMAAAY